MDILFDVPVLFEGKEKFTYHHYSLNQGNEHDDQIDAKTPLLLGALGISETELLLLFELLRNEMPFDSQGDTSLNRGKLSLLYRHARLAKALKWSIEEFIRALTLLFEPNSPVETLKQIYTLQEFQSWLKSSPFTVFDLASLILDSESGSNQFSIAVEDAAAFVLEYQHLKEQPFTEKLLAEIEGVSLEDSRLIIKQMDTANMLAADSDGYRVDPAVYLLTQNFKTVFEQSNISAEAAGKEEEIRAKLNEYHPFAGSYALYANIDLETFSQIIRFASADLGSAEFLNALQIRFDEDGNPEKSEDLEPVRDLLNVLSKTLFLFQKYSFNSLDMRFIADHPEKFAIDDLNRLNFQDMRSLAAYRNLISDSAEEKAIVHALLQNFSQDATAALLSDIWEVDTSLVESLIRSLVLPPSAVEAMTYLRKALDYCLKLGINGFSLNKLVVDENNYAQLTEARNIALGSFSSKYEDEKLRREKIEPYQDRINVSKRDALCDYIIAKETDLKFRDRNDIYSFFLLDAEMSGCFRTSRLVCGLSSLQLYVHRVLANLEQSANGDIQVLQTLASDDAGHLSQIRQEWEWRKNYRVWEANRKVFLYPENYLEPDLRDNKTPIFRELEDELLQEKITEESAEAAYTKYLSQFAELARLRISGNYYHETSGTYYFFGCTQQDPPQYYYRTLDHNVWTPWEKIELGINADYVSAVIHRGKLYLFWIERKEKEKTEVPAGTSKVTGATFETVIYYSFLIGVTQLAETE